MVVGIDGEQGYDRHALASSDERLDHAVVVESLTGARKDALCKQAFFDEPFVPAAAYAEHPLVIEVAQVPLSSVGSRHEDVRIGEEVAHLEGAVSDRKHREADVDSTGLDCVAQLLEGRDFAYLDLDERSSDAVASKCGGKDSSADALDRRHPHATLLAVGERCEIGSGRLHSSELSAGMAELMPGSMGTGTVIAMSLGVFLTARQFVTHLL